MRQEFAHIMLSMRLAPPMHQRAPSFILHQVEPQTAMFREEGLTKLHAWALDNIVQHLKKMKQP